MKNHPVGRAPDYTNAFLAMAFVWMMIALIAIWAFLGFLMAIVMCSFAHAWLAHKLQKRAEIVTVRD